MYLQYALRMRRAGGYGLKEKKIQEIINKLKWELNSSSSKNYYIIYNVISFYQNYKNQFKYAINAWFCFVFNLE